MLLSASMLFPCLLQDQQIHSFRTVEVGRLSASSDTIALAFSPTEANTTMEGKRAQTQRGKVRWRTCDARHTAWLSGLPSQGLTHIIAQQQPSNRNRVYFLCTRHFLTQQSTCSNLMGEDIMCVHSNKNLGEIWLSHLYKLSYFGKNTEIRFGLYIPW